MRTLRGARWIVLIAAAVAAGLFVVPAQAGTPDEDAVLAPIRAMIDGMAKRDSAAILQPMLPGSVMVLMRSGQPTHMTVEEFAERMGKPGTTHTEERMRDPLVRIDHDVAVVWAPYEYFVDGKLHHCGTNVFNLVSKDGKWMIAAVADTLRLDCAAK